MFTNSEVSVSHRCQNLQAGDFDMGRTTLIGGMKSWGNVNETLYDVAVRMRWLFVRRFRFHSRRWKATDLRVCKWWADGLSVHRPRRLFRTCLGIVDILHQFYRRFLKPPLKTFYTTLYIADVASRCRNLVWAGAVFRGAAKFVTIFKSDLSTLDKFGDVAFWW